MDPTFLARQFSHVGPRFDRDVRALPVRTDALSPTRSRGMIDYDAIENIIGVDSIHKDHLAVSVDIAT